MSDLQCLATERRRPQVSNWVVSRNLGTNDNRNGLTNELEAYLSIKVDDCLKSIEGKQNQGMEYETAKELALDDLFPKEHSEPDEGEIEGAQEDEIAAFGLWASAYSADSKNEDTIQELAVGHHDQTQTTAFS